MAVRKNVLKQRIKDGATVLVSFLRLPEPGLAEILGEAGLDGVIVDMEHGSMGWTEAERIILAAHAAATTPLLRIARNDSSLVMRALDIGAQGIIAPHIRSEVDACSLRESAFYPPEGHRGIGIGRPARWSAIPIAEYFATMNSEVLVGAMIEDREAVNEIDAIAALGLDLLFFGAADMSASVGELGASAMPKVMAMSEQVIAAANRHGVAVGFPSRSLDSACEAIRRGFRVIALGSAETLLLQHMRTLVSGARAAMHARDTEELEQCKSVR